ncbi:MAG: hypothetical protein PHX08_05740 [Lachnospiraceae bacterium]|nr:hypothetical protein [Lachnospiraceae bacterium]
MGIIYGVGYYFGEPLPRWEIFIANLFGFATNTNQYIGVGTAWYIGFYLIVMIITPILFGKNSKRNIVTALATMMVLYILKNTNCINNNEIQKIFNNLYFYIPIVLLGFYISKHKIIEQTVEFIEKYLNPLMVLFIAILCIPVFVLLRLALNHYVHAFLYVDWIIVLPFVVIMLLLYRNSFLQSTNIIGITKHTTNIWLLHSFIFTPNGSMQFLAYWPRIGVLVIIWTYFFCMVCSLLITPIQQYVLRLFEKFFPPKNR